MFKKNTNKKLIHHTRTRATVEEYQNLPISLSFRILQTLISPLAVVLFWALLFSIFFHVDIFSHAALKLKSEWIKDNLKSAENISIVTIDDVTKARLGVNVDNIEGIFFLVDEILKHSKPRLVVLDYALSLPRKKTINYDEEYLNNVIWGVIPYQRGTEWNTEGMYPGTFKFKEKSMEFRIPTGIQPWGHLSLGLIPGGQDTVSHIKLFKEYGDSLIPSLSMAAYGVGEFELSPKELTTLYRPAPSKSSRNCSHALFSNLGSCESLQQYKQFYMPPLPAYFPTFNAVDIVNNSQSKFNIFKHFDDKYVFLTSSWDKKSDYYYSNTSLSTGAIAKMFGMLDVVSVGEDYGKVPGVYFHASILETLINEKLNFPEVASLSTHILITLIVFSFCLFIAFFFNILISKLVDRYGHKFKERQESYFWGVFLLVGVLFFPVFLTVATYVLNTTDLIVNLMLGYFISTFASSYLIVRTNK